MLRDLLTCLGLPGRMLAFIVLLIVWALGLFLATIALAEPAPICVPGDRVQFAPVPEIVFVRGMPQTVQLGIYQIDPANPWTPGDLTRSSGWKSRFLTTLVHAGSAQAVEELSYDERTGELHYAGAWSGDLDVALISAIGGELTKAEFRVRVLTPTVVFGNNAEATNSEEGWNARTCQGVSFATCRKTKFVGGASDAAPLVVYVTPGRYTGDFYLGERRFVYVLGDPATRPTLVKDSLDTSLAERFYVGNLEQEDGSIKLSHAAPGYPSTMIVRNVRQCCETQQQNGISNPNGLTYQPWTVYVHDFEGQGMGGTGNTTHQFYVEGRPDSTFDLNAVRILGTRRSSAVKTTMQHFALRHSLLDVRVPGSHQSTHTPVDVPGFSDTVIYGNEFILTRVQTTPLPAAIFFRLRMPSFGSDIPAYPNVSWNPPRSNQATASSPGKGWAKGPETFVDDAFWADVKSQPLDDPANVLTFKHYVGFNTFRQLESSAAVYVIRDDGTHPAEATDQFGPMRAKRTHPAWVERSTTFLFGNTFLGQAAGQRLYNLTDSAFVKEIEPGAKWPRSKPEEFPRVVEITGELPTWFKL